MKVFVLLTIFLFISVGVSVSPEKTHESLISCSTSDTPPKQAGKS